MQSMYYIGLDVHKKTISYCVKDGSGQIHAEGAISATRFDLDRWMKTLPQPWTAAMEATLFTGWIYDHLRPHAAALKVAHPLMLRAIAAAKKKNDRIDANKIADCLRCDFLLVRRSQRAQVGWERLSPLGFRNPAFCVPILMLASPPLIQGKSRMRKRACTDLVQRG